MTQTADPEFDAFVSEYEAEIKRAKEIEYTDAESPIVRFHRCGGMPVQDGPWLLFANATRIHIETNVCIESPKDTQSRCWLERKYFSLRTALAEENLREFEQAYQDKRLAVTGMEFNTHVKLLRAALAVERVAERDANNWIDRVLASVDLRREVAALMSDDSLQQQESAA